MAEELFKEWLVKTDEDFDAAFDINKRRKKPLPEKQNRVDPRAKNKGNAWFSQRD